MAIQSRSFYTFVTNRKSDKVMNRNDIIKELGSYFDLQELVGPKEYGRDKNLCWRYFRTELLHTLLVVRRDILKTPMTVNNWNAGGSFSQRGFRSNVSDIVKKKTVAGDLYISAHSLGCAVDFDAKGMSAEEARSKIISNKNLLPYPIRLENGVTWVHLDTYDSGSGDKVTLF